MSAGLMVRQYTIAKQLDCSITQPRCRGGTSGSTWRITRPAMLHWAVSFSGFAYVGYYFGSLAYRGRLGRPGRWLYDRFQATAGRVSVPAKEEERYRSDSLLPVVI